MTLVLIQFQYGVQRIGKKCISYYNEVSKEI